MLARSEPGCQATIWKRELGNAITRPEELIEILNLDRGLLPKARAAAKRYRLLVPRAYVARMQRSAPNDPLLRQVLPLEEELRDPPGFCEDPVDESVAVLAPALLKKYRGRALLLVTGACAIHCRYCFRRHFPFGEHTAQSDAVADAINRIAADSSIREVILSGGDPLMLDDEALALLTRRLAAIPHLQRLRLHTRLPIVLPSRVTDDLCQTLNASRLQTIVVLHTNHTRELGTDVRSALQQLRSTGVPLFNQSVLLRSVNDNAYLLAELSETLFECGVVPYYLHLLDKVSGAAHFDLDQVVAVHIMDRLRALLPGYLVPRMVREIAGGSYKVPIDRGTMQQTLWCSGVKRPIISAIAPIVDV